jgi:hypothetical protein
LKERERESGAEREREKGRRERERRQEKKLRSNRCAHQTFGCEASPFPLYFTLRASSSSGCLLAHHVGVARVEGGRDRGCHLEEEEKLEKEASVFFSFPSERFSVSHSPLGDCFFSEIAQLLFLPFAQGPEPPLPIASFSNTGVQFLRI